jgi:hypothetical protein
MTKLSKQGKKLKRDIMRMYDFEDDPQAAAILEMGLQALSEVDRMLEVVEKDGELIPGQKGVLKPHPLLVSIRDNRLIFMRAMKQLGLPADDKKDRKPGRPPGRGF